MRISNVFLSFVHRLLAYERNEFWVFMEDYWMHVYYILNGFEIWIMWTPCVWPMSCSHHYLTYSWQCSNRISFNFAGGSYNIHWYSRPHCAFKSGITKKYKDYDDLFMSSCPEVAWMFCQYSVTEHFTKSELMRLDSLPGVYFIYDFSPIKVCSFLHIQ